MIEEDQTALKNSHRIVREVGCGYWSSIRALWEWERAGEIPAATPGSAKRENPSCPGNNRAGTAWHEKMLQV